MSIATTAAIAIGAGVAGSVASGIGSSEAAGAQENAAQQAQSLEQKNATQALGLQTTAQQQSQQNLSPYVQSGQQALGNIQNLGSFSAPTAQQAAETPGYQFQLQQGLQALQNSAAASGGLLTGGTAKAINNYAQGQAASNYGNTYNRALQTYQTNFGNQYALAGQGLQAGTNLSSLGQQNANASATVLQNSAQQQAAAIQNAGAARASGYAGVANAIGGGISGAGNSFANGIALNQLNAPQQPDVITSSGGLTWNGYGQ